MTTVQRTFSVLCLAGLSMLLAACSPYTLRGKVIQGDASYVTIVNPDDPRLAQSGLSGTHLRLVLDPLRLNRKDIATGYSGANGEIEMPVEEFGAGTLQFDVGFYARRNGFNSAEGYFRLPGSGKRILVVLAPGRDDGELGVSPENLYEEAERYRNY